MRVIAEIGSCFSSFEQAKDSIQIAAQLGADAVKFQLYDDKALYGYDQSPYDMPVPKDWLPKEWLPKLQDKAKAAGVEFMCSAFSPALALEVDPYVNTHKVASAEISHLRLLEMINTFKKPVIVSTGASTEADIRIALKTLKDCPVTLLYCVSEYPARAVNFDYMEKLKRFNVPVGFSDHTTDYIEIPRAAKARGATVIEKHVNFFDVRCPDSGHSLNREQFRDMIAAIKGQPVGPASELDMYLKHNRRLIAIRDISPGERFREGYNYGAFRSKQVDQEALPANYEDLYRKLDASASQIYIKQGSAITPQAI